MAHIPFHYHDSGVRDHNIVLLRLLAAFSSHRTDNHDDRSDLHHTSRFDPHAHFFAPVKAVDRDLQQLDAQVRFQ